MTTTTTSTVDLQQLREFAQGLIDEGSAEFPQLFDPVHGERDSIGPDDRLVPDALALREKIRSKSAAAGYYGGFMPQSAGGQGWSQETCVQVYETLANFPAFPQALWLDLSIFVTGQAWGPTPVLLAGSVEQQRRYLDPLLSGELTSCAAITDPDAGSDPHNMRATAVKTDGGYRLNGVKRYVGNAPYADLYLFYARTSGEPGDFRGISLFVIEKDNPGLEVTRVFPVMEGRGNHGEITLTDCEVSESALIGQEGRGFHYLMSFIDSGRLLLGALSLGGAQWCLDRAVERLTSRSTFGTPLADRQGLRWRVAEVQAQLVALRANLYAAARALDEGRDARSQTAAAKLLGPRLYHQAADMALQAFGGEGFMADHGIERHYRRARGMRIYMGTDEMQLNTIAKSVLGD